jgi:putative membrane-bound dehydrogenase-like protein
MCFDDRGRLWVAECYTYADVKTNYDLHLHDRIVIFEDSKGTGHFDKRTVFWDKGQRLTSIAVGFGGVFATCAPNLIFIPDRNGDDVPDGPPEVLLDGWNDDVVRHNIVNGLKWGPDGWLYGRHGILATSAVGKPGTSAQERTKLNCSIWRYHPTRKVFEVVCNGTTNPWGHDWDQYGNLMFINTVIGHLWQAIPGAFFKRMYGEHLAPHRYGLIDQFADHYHWDTGKDWTESRNAEAGADALGGGHAHTGMMIYQGDNWPEQYRGHLFTLNFHGRRINEDRLEQNGSGLVGRHETDFVKFDDPWFRGVELDYGPDGGVYVLDWSDTGECHGNNGVNRESGRIYKITYNASVNDSKLVPGPSALALRTNSLATFPDSELLNLQSHPNEWYARHARRILQERAESGAEVNSIKASILNRYEATPTNIPLKLRLMFVLHALGADSQSWLTDQLKNPDFHIRCWGVRFLAESGANCEELVPLFTKVAVEDPSAAVRLELASALQRMPAQLRQPLAAALVHHGEDANDHNLPLMLWYGIEPIVPQYPTNAIELAQQSRIPIVREYVARRLGEELSKQPGAIDALLQMGARANDAVQLDLLRGLAAAFQGLHDLPKPQAWDVLDNAVSKCRNQELHSLARQLGILFGDHHAIAELEALALQPDGQPGQRRGALEQLVAVRAPGLQPALLKLLDDPVTAGIAARGLMQADDRPEIASQVLSHWPKVREDDRSMVISSLAARVSSAAALLDAVTNGTIPRSALMAFHARQISNLKDETLNRRLAQIWGKVQSSDSDKQQLMAHYKTVLNPERLKAANTSRGREVFTQVCAVCHKLYGQGAAIGPDLTGGGRANLDYLLENIVDPNAIVPEDYRVSEVELKDDRSLTGLVVSRNERTITLQMPAEKLTIERSEITKMRQTTLSLMPEGLLQGLKEDQICNLIAYLMTPQQVPMPNTASK